MAKDKYSHILTVFSESVLMDDDYSPLKCKIYVNLGIP